MPLGFSGGKDLIAMGERYGVRRAEQIEQDGLKIEGALQKMTANRQLQGLGQTLAQLDPQTPDYTQKLMEVAPQFPEAMRDPRGQALFSMGVMANKQWEQRQMQTEKANRSLANQQTMQGIRQRDTMAQIAARNQGRSNQEVDLLQMPQRLAPQNPATGLMTGGMGGAMQAAAPQEAPDETGELMGMNGGMDSISERALTPLRDAQQTTGVKPNRTQVFSAIAGERTREQQQKLLDDRQAQQDKMAAARDAAKAKTDEVKAKSDEEKARMAETRQARMILAPQISGVERDISRLTGLLSAHNKKGGNDEVFFATKKELEGSLQAAGEERKRLAGELNALGNAAGEEKKLTKEAAADLLKEAGGDKEKARALARERGYTF